MTNTGDIPFMATDFLNAIWKAKNFLDRALKRADDAPSRSEGYEDMEQAWMVLSAVLEANQEKIKLVIR